MGRSDNQKLKLCYIMKILSECTSREDGITMQELIGRLVEMGVSAERKSQSSDIRALHEFGECMRVESNRKDGDVRYYADDRMFSLADIKILADVIAASKFVTEKRSRELIGKLERLVSAKEKRELNRSVYIRKHATDDDDDGYSNVDPIQTAIRDNRQIEFAYLQWDDNLQLVPREAGPRTAISPWWLVYNNENYYLGAYDGIRRGFRTFRVDKMRDVRMLDIPREGREEADNSRPEFYAQARFDMFDGEQQRVRVRCPKEMIGTFVDKIGRDITVMQKRGDTAELSFSVVPNRFFLTWLLALGRQVKLLSPQHCIDELESMCMRMVLDHERRQITTVIFDLGGVLLRLRPHEYMEELGFSEKEKCFIMDKVLLHEEWLRMDQGAISQDEAIAIWNEKYPEFAGTIRKFYSKIERFAEPYEDTERILQSLKDDGYEVYALSNYPREMFSIHERLSLPFLRLLDGYVISGVERRFKPNEDYYELFLSRYGKSASECVFVDDLPANVKTAESLGIHSFNASNRDAAFEELRAFLAAHRLED